MRTKTFAQIFNQARRIIALDTEMFFAGTETSEDNTRTVNAVNLAKIWLDNIQNHVGICQLDPVFEPTRFTEKAHIPVPVSVYAKQA